MSHVGTLTFQEESFSARATRGLACGRVGHFSEANGSSSLGKVESPGWTMESPQMARPRHQFFELLGVEPDHLAPVASRASEAIIEDISKSLAKAIGKGVYSDEVEEG